MVWKAFRDLAKAVIGEVAFEVVKAEAFGEWKARAACELVLGNFLVKDVMANGLRRTNAIFSSISCALCHLMVAVVDDVVKWENGRLKKRAMTRNRDSATLNPFRATIPRSTAPRLNWKVPSRKVRYVEKCWGNLFHIRSIPLDSFCVL